MNQVHKLCQVRSGGLKLKSTKGPHNLQKMFHGQHIEGQMALWAAVLKGRLSGLQISPTMTLFLHSNSFNNYILAQNGINVLTYQ
jgi:hypothetical protein